MAGSFELFDHTADMGIMVRAETMAGLLEPAAMGLYHMIGELKAAGADGVGTGGGAEVRTIEFSGDEPAAMLCDFLTELLIAFERDHVFVVRFDEVAFDELRLRARCTFAAVDMEASAFAREVKAITYHELSVTQTPAGCEARVIVDI